MNLLKESALEFLNKNNIDWLDGKKILITGASGLLGVNLVSILSQTKLKFECWAVVNSCPEKFFVDLIDNDDRFNFRRIDLANEFDDYVHCKYDVIFHFATYGQPNLLFTNDKSQSKSYFLNQIGTIKLNTEIVIKLLDVLKPDGKFVFLSTSEVYSGLTGKHKETEIGNTTSEHSRSCYIDSKKCGESICNVYRNIGYDVKVIRLCLGYGAGIKINDKRALNNFIYEALVNKEINLLDNGSAERTYCYVTDVLEMILNISKNGKDFIYNVGGTEVLTIKEIAEMIGKNLDVKVNIPIVENPVCGAVNSVSLDMSRYFNEFGVKQYISFNDGLIKTINWIKELHKRNG